MHFRIARHPVDDAVRPVGEPGAVDDVVGRFRGGEKCEVRDDRFLDSAFGFARNDNGFVISTKTQRVAWRNLDDKASSAGDVAEEEGIIGEAGGGPLVVVAVGAHNGLGGLEDGPQGGDVSRCGQADYHLS